LRNNSQPFLILGFLKLFVTSVKPSSNTMRSHILKGLTQYRIYGFTNINSCRYNMEYYNLLFFETYFMILKMRIYFSVTFVFSIKIIIAKMYIQNAQFEQIVFHLNILIERYNLWCADTIISILFILNQMPFTLSLRCSLKPPNICNHTASITTTETLLYGY
jgi:hypothetical protein